MSTVNAPSGRKAHSAVWTGTEMIIFGGHNCTNGTPQPNQLLNDGAKYNPTTDTWTTITNINAPIARGDHTVVWTGSEMVVWGGYSNPTASSTTNTGSKYNPFTDTWTPITTVGAPSRRATASGVWTGTEVIIWGGSDNCCGPSDLPSGGRYNPSTDTWSSMAAGDSEAGQKFHTAGWTGTEMIVWSGIGINGYTNKGQRYNPVTNTWTPMSTVNAPTPRAYSQGIWVGNRYFVWGGYDGATFPFLNTGGVYNPITDTWTTTTQTNNPTYRRDHTLVWTGTEIILWGGNNYDGNNLVLYNDGARYFSSVFHTIAEGLPVPLLKQTSDPWQDDVYDTASIWSPLNPTINRWGCALTSAAMVLNYHGLVNLNSTTPLDPSSLNIWLKGQPDGYIRNGLLNWIAISRLSKNIKTFNSSFGYDALEYKRVKGMDNTQLDADLDAGIPGIMEEPGHFIVAKGKTSDSYEINDPYYDRNLLTDHYENSYLSLGRYVPSNTDLSYIMLEVDPEVNITLQDENGNPIGEEVVQQPIVDPLGIDLNVGAVKLVYYPTPDSGSYDIIVSAESQKSYLLDVYIYDKNGNVKKLSYSELINDASDDQFYISFDKDTIENSQVVNNVSFANVKNDIETAEALGLINHRTAVLLGVAIKNAEKDYDRGKIGHTIKQLDQFKEIIMNYKKDQNNPVLEQLLEDLEDLKTFIQSA